MSVVQPPGRIGLSRIGSRDRIWIAPGVGLCILSGMLRVFTGLLIIFVSAAAAAWSRGATNRLSIALTTNRWRMGTVPVGGVAETWYSSPGYFVVTNNGTVAADVYLSVTNSTPSGWTPAGQVGKSIFSLQYATGGGDAPPTYTPLAPGGTAIGESLGTNRVLRFDLRFEAPHEADIGMKQEIRVNIMAIESE